MKRLFLAMLILSGLSVYAGDPDSSFTISGKFSNLNNGMVYLTIYGDAIKKDSAVLKKGKFSFKGFVQKPSTAFLTLKDRKGDRLQFYAEPGKMDIKGSGDKLADLMISGSALNDDDRKYKAHIKPAAEAEDKFYKIYDEAAQNKNQAQMDSLDAAEPGLTVYKRKLVSEYVYANPNALRSAMAIEQNYGYYAEAVEVEPLYNTLSASVRGTETGENIRKMLDIYKTVAIGKLAPEITQMDTTGKPVSLSSLKGKYVLVDFWASWCGPCRKENPNIVKAYNAYKDKGFDIFGVSYDGEKQREKWKKAIVSDGLMWTQVSDLQGWKNSTSDQYYIKAIPSNLLLDKEGRIIAKNLFGKSLTAKLAELMN